MKTLLLALLLLGGRALAVDWVVAPGGLSPNRKLAVAVFPQNGKDIGDADHTVLLVDHVKKRKFGPLEEVSSGGGLWGATATNVHCAWSPDGALLFVRSRSGRLMGGTQIYRIQNRRAIPLTLPDITTHPKGLLLRKLQTSNNPGSEASLDKYGGILQRVWGYMLDWNEDYSRHGLEGFTGTALFHYRFDKKGRLVLRDITVPSEP